MTGTMVRTKEFRTLVALVFALLLVGTTPLRPVRASGDVTIFDQAPDGIAADVWASAEVEPLAGANRLGLERIALDACAAVALDGNSAGPILIVAESFTVNVTTVYHGAVVATTLAQGESTLMPAKQGFRLSNGMGDPAFRATALMLYPAGDGDEPMARTGLKSGDSFVEWEEGSFCEDIRGTTATTLFVLGSGGKGANRYYVGSVSWAAGATTEGYAVADQAATFNVVILSGGMGNGGVGTGRAFHAGPYRTDLGPHQAMSDAMVTQPGGMSSPFANTGAAPVFALIFGTATAGTPVYAVQG
jgi:hypothetical protein